MIFETLENIVIRFRALLCLQSKIEQLSNDFTPGFERQRLQFLVQFLNIFTYWLKIYDLLGLQTTWFVGKILHTTRIQSAVDSERFEEKSAR